VSIPIELLLDQSRWPEADIPAFLGRNSRTLRGPEITNFAEALKASHSRVGVMGICYGGWGAFSLGAKDSQLVNCISVAHPSMLEEQDIDSLSVPVQILAPEHDPQFTEELKAYSNRVIPKLGIAYDYQHFPGLEHGFASRGDPKNAGERAGMQRAKFAAVGWFRQWLHAT
jgi:dienelactone hydrolase